MGRVVEYPGSRDDDFGSFLDRTRPRKVSCSFQIFSC